jgi:tRNA-2-methylthio-N6-dimethylallyladenosine synthase
LKKKNPKVKIILTGCLAKREDVKARLKNFVDFWLPIQEISTFKFIFSKNARTSEPESKIQKSELSQCEYFKIQPKHSSKFSAFVPIGNGCNNFCTYCVVPYARGYEAYRPVEDILNEVNGLIKRGYKEIILIAQNVNSYRSVESQKHARRIGGSKVKSQRKDINFAGLLKLINDIPGDFWVRFYTSHPKDMSQELIDVVFKCDKVCRHIHLPAQAGDNEILKAMNRKYTIEHYKDLIKRIRIKLNKTSVKSNNNLWQAPAGITTDLIVGFPDETNDQFKNSVKLFKEIKFDMAYISKYSPRPGTVAEKFDDNISKDEKIKREDVLTKILRQTSSLNNKKYINKIVRVLIEGKSRKGKYYGKTETAKIVKTDSIAKIGEFTYLKINAIKDFGLEGVLVK